jgi:hypothetical protein
VDLTPPTQPTWIQSKDHVPGQWSADSDLGMAWEVSVDEDCGLVFYEIVWNESNQPPTLPWFTGVPNAEYTVSPLADGAEWWFHAWAHDGAANYVAQPVSAGPFLIDTTPPTPPNLHPSLPPGQWTNTTSLNIDWDGALDDGSGLAGYHWLLDQAVSTDPSITPVRPDSSETYAGLVEGQHWFHLSPVDAVDNTGPPQHLGPFLLDLTPPSGEITQPPVGSVLHHTDPVLIEWIASDVLSGVAQISLFWSPDGYDTLYPIADGSAAQMGNSWNWTVPFVVEDQLWLEMVLEDGAGNQAVFELPAPYEVTRAVGVDGPVASVPDRLVLGRNVPNPFNPQTEIVYALPAEGMVRLVVYDASGRAVRTLVSEVEKGPAWHRVIWDGRADDGRRVSSGAYFYRLEAAGEARSRRMVLVK